MSFDRLLNMNLSYLPVIVVVLLTWLLLGFGHRLILALLGRAQPVEIGLVTPVGRFLGGALAVVLAPVQQMLAIVGVFLVLSSGFFVVDHFRLYDDGLVDTTATIVGRTRRCIPPGIDEKAALPTAPACGFTYPQGKRVIDALDVTFVSTGGVMVRAAAPLYLAKDGRTAVGDTFEAAYSPTEPFRLGRHVSDNLLVGPEKLLLAGLLFWALSMAMKRIRRALAGRRVDDEGALAGLRGLFRRRQEAAPIDIATDLVRRDVGLVTERSLMRRDRPNPTSDRRSPAS